MAEQYVNGRRAILQMLDSLLAEEKNIKRYKEIFQERIDAEGDEPMKFFQNVVMPLIPKDSLGDESEKDKSQSPVTIVFQPAPPKE